MTATSDTSSTTSDGEAVGQVGREASDRGPDPTGKRFCINSAALDFEGEE